MHIALLLGKYEEYGEWAKSVRRNFAYSSLLNPVPAESILDFQA